MRARTAIALAATACLAMPAAARAATVELSVSVGLSGEEFILYRAGKGERNRVHVTIGRRSVTIVDHGVRRIALRRHGHPTTCRRPARRRVVCPHDNVQLVLGDKNDKVSFSPGTDSPDTEHTDPLTLADTHDVPTEGAFLEASDIDGGRGNDVIKGSKYYDVIRPGPGRDRVDGRGGGDDIVPGPDGQRDSIRGGGGVDSIVYIGQAAVTVDLAAGTGGRPGDTDRLEGIEQPHGGPNDVLLGSENGDALYGEHVDGRGGNDLLVSDSTRYTVTGGPGDDVIDARTEGLNPTTKVDCGPGSDRVAGEVDDLLDPSCEAAAFRIPVVGALFLEQPLWDVTMKVAPVARAADGSPTFEVPCPAMTSPPTSACSGTVAVERPPVAGSSAPPESFGSGSFNIAPGQRANVMVQLTPAGQMAVSSGSPVAVHVTANLPQTGPPPGGMPLKADFGWQEVLPP
jgi:hypothetical protein